MVPLFLLSAILELDDSPREGLKLSRIRPDDPRVLILLNRSGVLFRGLLETPSSYTLLCEVSQSLHFILHITIFFLLLLFPTYLFEKH